MRVIADPSIPKDRLFVCAGTPFRPRDAQVWPGSVSFHDCTFDGQTSREYKVSADAFEGRLPYDFNMGFYGTAMVTSIDKNAGTITVSGPEPTHESHVGQQQYRGLAAWLPKAGEGGSIFGVDRTPQTVLPEALLSMGNPLLTMASDADFERSDWEEEYAWRLFFTDQRVISIMEHRGSDWRRPIEELRELVYEREKSIREECEARAKAMYEVPL